MRNRFILFILLHFAWMGSATPARDSFAGLKRVGQSPTSLSETRIYDATKGAFLAGDPLFLHRPEDCVKSPQDCNLYSYAQNAPGHKNDPDGLETKLANAKSSSGIKKQIGGRRPHPGYRNRNNRRSQVRLRLPNNQHPNAWVQGVLNSVNPYAHMQTLNCANCAIVLDNNLAGGHPMYAFPGNATYTGDVAAHYGRAFSSHMSNFNMRVHIANHAPGTRFIVFGARNGGIGHFFNAVVTPQGTDFLDGQSASRAHLFGYSSFMVLRTSP